MRIALICTEKLTVPSIRGGAIQILIDGIVPYLREKNDVTVFCVEDDELPCFEQRDHLKYVRVKREGYSYEAAKIISKKRASSEKFDLIHVFNRPKDLLIYKSASPESRFVLSLHNEMFGEGKITYELGNLVVSACDRIITVSEYIKRTVLNRFPLAEGKIFAFYSGVEIGKFHRIYDENIRPKRKAIRQQYGITDENKVILFVGRLSKVKGVDILIKAFSKLRTSHPEAYLLIVGSKWFSDDSIDEYGKKIRDIIVKEQIKNVAFTGFVPPVNIPDMFLAGDIFVCSSQWQEPLARVHYEAMASGLPIITTNRGGNAEIIRNNVTGIVIDDYSNPDAFCEKMKLLIESPKQSFEMGSNAFEEACGRYDFKYVYERISTYYQQAMDLRKHLTDNTNEAEKADEVLREYPVVFHKIELLNCKTKKCVFKIYTNCGCFILKKMPVSLEKIKSIIEGYEKLIEKDCRLPEMAAAYGDRKYIEKDGSFYLLYEYIEGRKPDCRKREDLEAFVNGLAYFHGCAVSHAESICLEIFKKNIRRYSRYASRFNELKSIYSEMTEPLSDYDSCCNEFIETAIAQCKRAEIFMNKIRDSKMEIVMCHGDYTAGNTVIRSDGELYIFDLDSIEWDFSPRDLRRLCNKIMKELENGWDLDVLLDIYKYYVNIRELSDFEKNYLMMELWYSHLFYEQIEKYYRNKEPDWTSDKYIKCLKKAIKSERTKEKVLIEFEKML